MEDIKPPTGELKANRIENAQKTFFFERHDGSIFASQEEEAWMLLNGRTKVIGPQLPKPKLIGVSDGQKFMQAVTESHALHKEGKIEEALARLKTGEAEELEAARGNIEMPRNFDKIDSGRNPIKLGQLQ